MAELFDEFPYLMSDTLIIKQMEVSDVAALSEITNNDNVYKYIPPSLYKKSDRYLETAIKNLSGRDFIKKRLIMAGVYLKSNPDRLIGLAEMFDYKKRENKITVGYRLNESYWNQGIATETLKLMMEYLVGKIGIHKLQAFVMPQNVYSSKVLLHNGFLKEDYMVQKKNWGGQEFVMVNIYTFVADNKKV